jgi:hypothetical protein
MTEHTTEIPEFLPKGIYDFTVANVREKESPEGSPIIEFEVIEFQPNINKER